MKKNKAAVVLGRLGGKATQRKHADKIAAWTSKGGKALRAKSTLKERKARARKAATARWSKRKRPWKLK